MTEFEIVVLLCHPFYFPSILLYLPYTIFHTVQRGISHPPHICNALLSFRECVCDKAVRAHINGATVQVSCSGMMVETVKQEKCPSGNLFLSHDVWSRLMTALSGVPPFVETLFVPFGLSEYPARSSRSSSLTLFFMFPFFSSPAIST